LELVFRLESLLYAAVLRIRTHYAR